MPRKRTRRRGKGEGSIFDFERKIKRKDGSIYIYEGWQGEVVLGYDEDGKRRRKTVYGRTQGEVIEKIAEIRGELSDGTHSTTDLTMKAYLERWLKEKERQVRPRTVEFYGDLVRRHITPSLGRVRLAKLTPMQVQAFIGDTADESSVGVANQCRTTLFTAMKQAVRWQLIARNPVEAVEKLKAPQSHMTIWSTEQASLFLDVAQEHRLYPAFVLAISAGLRRGEILGLRWGDIKGSTLHVAQTVIESRGKISIGAPKTNRGTRRVALSPDVVATLETHRLRIDAERAAADGLYVDLDLVFPTTVGTAMHPRNLERLWYTLQEKANERLQGLGKDPLPRVRLHDLRHLNVSIRRRMGQDAKLIADQIGHTDPSFTMRLYAHLFDDERQSAAVDLTQALGARFDDRDAVKVPQPVDSL